MTNISGQGATWESSASAVVAMVCSANLDRKMRSFYLRIVSLGLLATLFFGQAQANGFVQNVTVAETAIGRGYGSFVFIRLSALPVGTASCAGSPTLASWHFTLPLDGTPASQALYAMLLSAQISGRKLDVSGLGLCNEFGTIESVSTINLLPE